MSGMSLCNTSRLCHFCFISCYITTEPRSVFLMSGCALMGLPVKWMCLFGNNSHKGLPHDFHFVLTGHLNGIELICSEEWMWFYIFFHFTNAPLRQKWLMKVELIHCHLQWVVSIARSIVFANTGHRIQLMVLFVEQDHGSCDRIPVVNLTVPKKQTSASYRNYSLTKNKKFVSLRHIWKNVKHTKSIGYLLYCKLDRGCWGITLILGTRNWKHPTESKKHSIFLISYFGGSWWALLTHPSQQDLQCTYILKNN